MPNILEEIVEQTAVDLKKRKRKVSFNDLSDLELFESQTRDFKEALVTDDVGIIAEIKKASPSKGVIRKDFNPQKIARQYQQGGASAISVLTDNPAFQGSLDYLKLASTETNIPLLRKDFIIDPYQVKEAKAYGADAVLLIVSITDGNQLAELIDAAQEYELGTLVECYTHEDLKRVDFEDTDILGVNNRDLRTFDVDLHRGIEQLHQAPEDTVLVSESGLSSANNLHLLFEENIDAALIGEYFMRQPNPGRAVQQMKEELQQLITQKS